MEHQILIREPSGEQKWLPISEVFRIARSYKKPTATPVGTLVGFQEFWDLYDNKKGRSKAEIAWKRHVKKNLVKIILAHVKNYVKATPDKQYRKHASTYLNGHSWNDEITQQEEKIDLDLHYPLDKTGRARLSRCSKCNKIHFGDIYKILSEDSSCCKVKIKQYR